MLNRLLPTPKKMMVLSALVVLLCLVYPVAENWVMFKPGITANATEPLSQITAPRLRAQIKAIRIPTPDGETLSAWYVAPKNDQPTIVFAHGNSGNLGDRWAVLLPFVDKGYGFLAVDYRGYGQSTGHPSEQGLYTDMRAASHYLVTTYHTPTSQQIIMGGSLGGGVAAELASTAPYQAVILYSTYTSMPDVARYQLRQQPYLSWLALLPWQWIVQQDFDSLSKMSHITAPLVVAHGEHDTLFPPSMGKRLYQQAGSRKKRWILDPTSGHGLKIPLLVEGLEAVLAKP